jgi:predicted nucleic acid-binding protein
VQVLVDTSIWSLALRRSRAQISDAEKRITSDLRDFIQDGRARLIGSIRQELLSGIRDPAQFERLKTSLRAFPDEPASRDDYEEAARWSNQCRSRGIAGSGTDFLICAVAIVRGWQIFTRDDDFQTYARVLPLKLYLTGGARNR